MTATSQHTASVELTVGQVAQTFGVTVRILHHYDAEGLVVPSARTHAGYRLYTDADLSRLAVVVTYRRLGLPLTQVRDLLDGQGSAAEHLRRQREAVLTRRDELIDLVTAIAASTGGRDERPTRDHGRAQGARRRRLLRGGPGRGGAALGRDRRVEAVGVANQALHPRRLGADQGRAGSCRSPARGDGAGGPRVHVGEAMDAVEAHRAHIARWFYDLDHTVHRGLADLHIADPRFTKTYADQVLGLVQYVHDAIHANADRHDRA